MKKYFLVFGALVCMSILSYAGNENYKIDNAAVDNLFQQSTEVGLNQVSTPLPIQNFDLGMSEVNRSRKSAWTAAILCAFLGELGVHRWYLGTGAGVVIFYLLTCGGCEIVYVIDFYVLIFIAFENKSIKQYVGSKRLFMWA